MAQQYSYWDEGWIDRANSNETGGEADWGRWSEQGEDGGYGEWIKRPDRPGPTYTPWSADLGGAQPGGFIGGKSIVQRNQEPDGSGGYWMLDQNFDPYAYRQNKDQVPELSDFYNAWNAKHLEQYGTPYNRPWNKHGESGLRDQFVKQYEDAIAEYNQIHGTDLKPDRAQIDAFGAAPTEWAASDPTSQKESFFGSPIGQMVLMGASFFGAPYLSAFLGGGLAGSIGAGAIMGGGGAALTGGNILQGAALGGLGGGLGYGLNGGAAAGDGSGWTSGYDLPMGNTAGLGWTGAAEAAAGAAAGGAGTGWTSGYDLPMGGGESAGWVSGSDLPMGIPGGGAAAAGGAGATGGAAATGGATATGATATGGAASGIPPVAGAAAAGLTGNATADKIIQGLSAAGVPQALIGTVVSNLVADGLFGAGDARDAARDQSNAATAALNQQAAIAGDQYNRWKQTYAPLEEELVALARAGLSGEEINAIMGTINADATDRFATAREGLDEDLRRRGIAPGSGAQVLGLSQIGAAEAASKTGAQTQAKEQIRQFNRGFATNVANVGRGIPQAASASLASNAAGNASLAAGNRNFGMMQEYAAGQATAPFVRAATKWFDDNLFKPQGSTTANGMGSSSFYGGWNNLEFGSGGYA